MANAFRVVFITAPSGKKAEALARGLVSARLAACVNVAAAVSHYRWDERLRRDEESLMIVKTSAAKLPALKRWIEEHHPYTVPEVLAIKVEDGSKPYLQWLASELK